MLTEVEFEEHVFTDAEGVKWLPAPIAAELVPSIRRGKRTHPNTLKQLWRDGVLDCALPEGRRNTRYYRVDQILALGKVRKVERPGAAPPTPARVRRETEAELERMGRALAPGRAARALKEASQGGRKDGASTDAGG